MKVHICQIGNSIHMRTSLILIVLIILIYVMCIYIYIYAYMGAQVCLRSYNILRCDVILFLSVLYDRETGRGICHAKECGMVRSISWGLLYECFLFICSVSMYTLDYVCIYADISLQVHTYAVNKGDALLSLLLVAYVCGQRSENVFIYYWHDHYKRIHKSPDI